LLAVPPAVVTLTLPDVLVASTAVIVLALTTAKEDALMLPNLTAVAPAKLAPVMLIVFPIPPPVGVKDVMMGAGTKVKPALDEVPFDVVTDTEPVEPFPSIATIKVVDGTVNEATGVPPKLTAVVLPKFAPLIFTVMPGPALAGEKPETIGPVKVKPVFVAVPSGVVTLTAPEEPEATTAEIEVGEITENELAGTPPKLTAVAPDKLAPVMVTVLPVEADKGLKEEIVGPEKVKPGKPAVPVGLVTLTKPVAPLPSVAEILVGELMVNAALVPPKLTLEILVNPLPEILTT
jgi:hypothetical protein